MTVRARSFLAANAESRVVYGSVTDVGVTYRLENGKVFNLSRADCQHVGHPRWAHLDIAA